MSEKTGKQSPTEQSPMPATDIDSRRTYDDRSATSEIVRTEQSKTVCGSFEAGQFIPVHASNSDATIVVYSLDRRQESGRCRLRKNMFGRMYTRYGMVSTDERTMDETATGERNRAGRNAKTIEESPAEIGTVFDSLNNEDTRAVIAALDEGPLSAKEVSERCELSMSTTYRKLNRLSDAGLLEEGTAINLDGKHPTTYRRCVDTIAVTITDDGFELELSGGTPTDDAVLQA